MDPVKLNVALEALARRVKPSFSEDAVEHSLTETGFYEALGYRQTGRDIRRKQGSKSGIPDALLLNSDDSVQVVVEVKRPSEVLEDHLEQLRRYVLALRAPFGILVNGTAFRLYRRNGQTLDELTSGLTTAMQAQDFTEFAKQTLDPMNKAQIEGRIRQSQLEGLPVRHVDDIASEQFLYSLGLNEGSPFAELVQATVGLLGNLQGKSDFVGGSYDFWKKIYARELDAERIPKLWKESGALQGVTETELYRFSFALESCYALAARLMLAKVIQDHSGGQAIAGTRSLADQLLFELERHVHPRTGNLEPDAYPQAVRELFDLYARTLFTSVYATDIFDWWRDYSLADPAAARAFADALAKLLLALLRFDFSTLEGDLLGELYQRYFDPETRKALGEFYTPPAVVEFMLDEVEYHGAASERLLDPATGSGTFIISALRRYLRANHTRDPLGVLRGLTEDYVLVAFDINPFAVMMAQVNFAALLVPLFAKAVTLDPQFVLRRLPIIRTDSLRQEGVEDAQLSQGSQKGSTMLGLDFVSKEITAQIELPIRSGGKLGHTVRLTFPQIGEAKRLGIVDNERQWLRALQAVFAAVEARSQAYDRHQPLPDVSASIRTFLARARVDEGQLQTQTDFLTPYAERVWDTLLELKRDHGDGRFLKTLEDLMLGLVLKNYLKYDVVVGNPPYVRIQNLPEDLRRYWEGLYVWVDGNFDIYIPFVERALLGNEGEAEAGWLRPGGRLSYILPNRFMNAGYAKLLRANLPRIAHIHSLLNMGAATFLPPTDSKASKLFREAMVYPAILSVRKNTDGMRAADAPDDAPAFPAVRLVPRTLPIDPAQALGQIRQTYTQLRDGQPADLGDLGDAVLVAAPHHTQAGRRDFTSAGWYVMPPAERVVFEKLDKIGTQIDPQIQAALTASGGGDGSVQPYRRLRNYTATISGGFAGVQTSLDSVMVLREIGQSADGLLLTLKPRGGGDPVTIEKAALRPFLFGKDVERWHIDWQKWWVIFPYMHTDTGFRLMPSARYRDFTAEVKARGRGSKGKSKAQTDVRYVFGGYPAELPNIEDLHPHLWTYLNTHEKVLRGRENGKYRVGKSDEWRWYEIAYARSIEIAPRPNKLLLQTASIYPRLVADQRGYLFAGSGTHNAYGLAISEAFDSQYISAVVGSNASDFLIKSISSVFAGGYYSYGDQFIRDLPIPASTAAQRERLAAYATALTANTGELRGLEARVSRFPDSVSDERRASGHLPDLEELGNVAQVQNLAQNIDPAHVTDLGGALLGPAHYTTLKVGNGGLTLGRQHADLVLATLAVRGKMKREELTALRVPERGSDVRGYLDTLAQWTARIDQLRAEIAALEAHLNDAVYGLYGLDTDERAVIERFLARF